MTQTASDNQPRENVQHIRVVLDEVLAKYGVTDFGRTPVADEQRLESALEPQTGHHSVALAG